MCHAVTAVLKAMNSGSGNSRHRTVEKRYKAEEIVAKLRQVDVLTSQGQSMADAIRLVEAGYGPATK
jgi:hypothetical protein